MQTETKKISTLQKMYLHLSPAAAKFFKQELIKFYNCTEQSFYNKMRRPTVQDIALYFYVFGKTATDAVLRDLTETHYSEFTAKEVAKYTTQVETILGENINNSI